MPEVFPKDVLLRVGGRALARHGVLAVAGSRRGLVDVPYTFARADATTCATYIDRDGIVRLAAANIPRIEWVDLDGDGIRETPGILLEGSRTNTSLRSEEIDNATWVKTGGPPTVVANATTAPDGASTADRVVPAASLQNPNINQAITITANEACAASIYVKPSGYTSIVLRFSNAGSTQGFQVSFDASTGLIGTINAGFGGGTLQVSHVTALANGWYRLDMAGTIGGGITAAAFFVFVYNNIAGANAQTAFTGDGTQGVYLWGAQLERGAAFASSYIKTVASAVTRAADSFTVPFNFGPMDLTMLHRIARPVWADAVGNIGIFNGLSSLGTAVSRLRVNADNTIRQMYANPDTPASSPASLVAIPAGASLTFCSQWRNLTTGPKAKIDAGSGFAAESSAATAFAAFGDQTLRVGGIAAGSELYGVLLDVMVLRGLFSYAEAGAVP